MHSLSRSASPIGDQRVTEVVAAEASEAPPTTAATADLADLGDDIDEFYQSLEDMLSPCSSMQPPIPGQYDLLLHSRQQEDCGMLYTSPSSSPTSLLSSSSSTASSSSSGTGGTSPETSCMAITLSTWSPNTSSCSSSSGSSTSSSSSSSASSLSSAATSMLVCGSDMERNLRSQQQSARRQKLRVGFEMLRSISACPKSMNQSQAFRHIHEYIQGLQESCKQAEARRELTLVEQLGEQYVKPLMPSAQVNRLVDFCRYMDHIFAKFQEAEQWFQDAAHRLQEEQDLFQEEQQVFQEERDLFQQTERGLKKEITRLEWINKRLLDEMKNCVVDHHSNIKSACRATKQHQPTSSAPTSTSTSTSITTSTTTAASKPTTTSNATLGRQSRALFPASPCSFLSSRSSSDRIKKRRRTAKHSAEPSSSSSSSSSFSSFFDREKFFNP